ncbi:MAG: histidinol dehydrogenase [Prevotella sp.]|nr:histidinol dehydrogenase [Prevotella sp.]
MNIIKYPTEKDYPSICERPHLNVRELNTIVTGVLDDIKKRGDRAIFDYEERFDHVRLSTLTISDNEINEAWENIDRSLRDAILLAHDNIRIFHESQKFKRQKVQTAEGVTCWQKSVPIQRVGLYIPGGTAPLFSTVLMLATPAKIAGCEEIVLCTPPDKEGRVNPAILVAAKVAGVSRIIKAGGIQAIGAMAYGTETVPKVFKVFGPGNQYVMAAKQHVSLHDVAIDMPAGPSEVCVIADESSNPSFVAADLLSQAEHGIDSQVILIVTSEEKSKEVTDEIELQLKILPRRDIAAKTLENSKIIIVHDTDEAIKLSNVYAPEHLIINTVDYEQLAERVVNAGSVFLGPYACESAGDYASGTNHTLPTHGYACSYSGVNLDSFCRKITFQYISEEGINSIGRAVEIMAENEQLDAHKNAMTVRIDALKKDNLSE